MVNLFRKIKHEKRRNIIAYDIFNKYLTDDSDNEINVDNGMKNKIKNILDNDKHCPRTLFDDAEYHTIITLKDQVSYSFLESKCFKQYIVTQPLSLLFEIGMPKNNTPLYYIENLSWYGNIGTCFTSNEFEFLSSQLAKNESSDEWECLGSNDNYACYYSKNTYDFGPSKGLNFFKYYVTIPYGVDQCYPAFKELKYRKNIDRNLINIEQLDYISPVTKKDYYTSITREEYKLTFPFKNREFIVSTSCIKTGNNYLVGMKTTNYDAPKKKGVIRCPSVGGWLFNDIDGKSTRYSQFHYIDFKGNVPKSVMKILLHKRAKQFQKTAIEQIELFLKDIPTNDNRIEQTMIDNTI
jgi:hypothetical protein